LQSREKGVKEGLWIRLVMLNQCETCSAHPQQHADSKWTVPSPARLPVEGKVRRTLHLGFALLSSSARIQMHDEPAPGGSLRRQMQTSAERNESARPR